MLKYFRDGLERAGQLVEEQDLKAENKPLTLKELNGAILVAIALYVPCILALCFEVIIGKVKKEQSMI